jgi:high affinity sulfate transporter 1
VDERTFRWRHLVFRSLDGYRRAWVARDLTAGVLIVAVAVPLSMGMAEVAGMPPVAGLYSCVLPLIAYALLGSSRQLVVALDASTAAMLAAAVAPLAVGDPARYAVLAAGLTLAVGGILILAGLLRLGGVAEFLSEPVLLGYQAGLAVTVIVSQLPRLVGVAAGTGGTLGRVRQLVDLVPDADGASLALTSGIAAITLLVVLVGRRWRPRIPTAVIAVALATLAVAVLHLDGRGVAVIGSVPQGYPPFSIPGLEWADARSLLGPAAAIALVAAADTLVSSRVFAARNGYEVSPNADLVGLGAANAASGVSGGITISASAARTAVAESVGSRSQVAGVTAAVLMLLVLTTLTPLLRRVPQAALGAVVVAAVLRLIEVGRLRRLLRIGRAEFAVAAAAVLGVIVFGVLQGVVIAMGLSLIDFVRRTSRPHDAILGLVPGRTGYHDTLRNAEASTHPAILVYRFDAPLFYANAERFRQRVRRLARRHHVWLVVIDAAGIPDIDASACTMLEELTRELGEAEIALVLADVVGPVLDTLERAGALDVVGRDRVFDTIEGAVENASVRPG